MKDISNNERIAINTVFLAFRMVVVLLISLYTTRVLLAALGIEDYGIYNVVAGFVSMCSFISTSMSSGIQRFFNYERGKNGIDGGKRVFNVGIRIQVLISLLLIVIIEAIGIWYIQHKMVVPQDRVYAAMWVFQAALLSLVLTMLAVPFNASIMAHEKMNYFAFLGIIDAVFKLVIALIISHVGADRLIVYAFLLAIVSAINLILNFIYSRINFEEIRLTRHFDRDLLKTLLIFSGWNAFGTMARTMRTQGVGMVLNLFFGPVVNAAQGVAGQVKSAFQALVANLTTASRPQIIQSYSRGDIDRTIKLMFSISKLVLYLLFVFAYPLLLELPYVLSLWLGEIVPMYTVVFVRLVVVTMFITDIHMVTSTVVHATGQMKTYQLVCSGLNIMIIPLVYMAMKMGAEAEIAFWLGLLIEFLVQVASLFILKHLMEFSIMAYIRVSLFPFVKVVALSFSLPLMPFLLMDQGVLRFLAVSIIAVLWICFVVYNWGLNNGERQLITTFVHRVTKNNNK